jgi:hypothetical protein
VVVDISSDVVYFPDSTETIANPTVPESIHVYYAERLYLKLIKL